MRLILSNLLAVIGLLSSVGYTMEVPLYDFPIDAYSQQISDYLSPDAEDYSRLLLTPEYQAYQQKQFFQHYYASDQDALSPWSEHFVTAILPTLNKIEEETLNNFNNVNKSPQQKHYGENFKEHDYHWWSRIKTNMDLPVLADAHYADEHRAIAVANTTARTLPDIAPDFFHVSLPGEGFPFDNLQDSAVWTGTPLYVCSTSRDKAWSLVITPDGYYAWVKSHDIAYVSPGFVEQWQQAAAKQLVAITKTETPVFDSIQQFQFQGYIGAVFPFYKQYDQHVAILIPTKTKHNQAQIKVAQLDKHAASMMPLPATKKNMSKLLLQLQSRPYGWGGSYFYNDCSQEIKSLFTPLGIWLPRNSAAQANTGSSLDLSENSLDERLSLLKAKGHPLMTLIYIGGHVMLYLGTKAINQETAAMTYQNIWGLAPANRDKRYIIGQSVFLPLLKNYPENADANSLANKPIFKLVYLDEKPLQPMTVDEFVSRFSVTPRTLPLL